jgi:hypothetical protein
VAAVSHNLKEASMPNNYSEVARKAAQRAREGTDPVASWSAAAAEVFAGRPSAQRKSCPKTAFLGLAEAGLIKGVPDGKYTRSIYNKRYALDAVDLLQEDETWCLRPKELWSLVAEKTEAKQHNGQMDVVLALWQSNNLIRKGT